MADTLSFQIQLPLLMNEQLNDNGGNWQYVGANVIEQSSGASAQLVAMKRENTIAGVTFSASMLTATILYPVPEGGEVSPSLTIQGVHDLTTNNEIGSVSSASSDFADYIGGQFVYIFDATTGGVLTIFSR
jgi:hypothetical protein